MVLNASKLLGDKLFHRFNHELLDLLIISHLLLASYSLTAHEIPDMHISAQVQPLVG